jgi:hypothetical protein
MEFVSLRDLRLSPAEVWEKLRRARAQAAVSRMRRAAAESSADRLPASEIEAEIAQARRERGVAPAGE